MKTFEQIARTIFETYKDGVEHAYPRAPAINSASHWQSLGIDKKNAWIDAAKAAHKEITEVH